MRCLAVRGSRHPRSVRAFPSWRTLRFWSVESGRGSRFDPRSRQVSASVLGVLAFPVIGLGLARRRRHGRGIRPMVHGLIPLCGHRGFQRLGACKSLGQPARSPRMGASLCNGGASDGWKASSRLIINGRAEEIIRHCFFYDNLRQTTLITYSHSIVCSEA
jgi:hypothetical protein